MVQQTILVVDDDEDIREVLRLHLTHNGYKVFVAENGLKALELFEQHQPHLIVLDVMMPESDGFEVCITLRKRTDVPIIFLSAKEDATDKIAGLRLGGDDYMTKPFNMGELIARVKVLLRRHHLAINRREERDHDGGPSVLHFPGMEIDLNSCDVRVNGRLVSLSPKEFQLLTFLAQKPGHVFTLEQLFQAVWHTYSYGDIRTVLVHISNLRKKIEPDPTRPRYIVTVRGRGYKFSHSDDDDAPGGDM